MATNVTGDPLASKRRDTPNVRAARDDEQGTLAALDPLFVNLSARSFANASPSRRCRTRQAAQRGPGQRAFDAPQQRRREWAQQDD